jgi:hypothetical protein
MPSPSAILHALAGFCRALDPTRNVHAALISRISRLLTVAPGSPIIVYSTYRFLDGASVGAFILLAQTAAVTYTESNPGKGNHRPYSGHEDGLDRIHEDQRNGHDESVSIHDDDHGQAVQEP